MKQPIGIEINGTIYSNEGNIEEEEFFEAFIEFVESKGWFFGGGISQIDGVGNVIKRN
jgi:uncharacterized protein YggL (DUF469 family)